MPEEYPDMTVIEGTALWQRTLAENAGDGAPRAQHKKLLRDMLLLMRARVANLAGDISKDLPQFTIHDLSHLDALWEMADLILGPDYELTTTEAFLFGCAVLLHDAGLTVSAYPGGLAQIKAMPEWKDRVVLELRKRQLPESDAKDIADPPKDITAEVVSSILRDNHARQAMSMATDSWSSADGRLKYHLLEDVDARRDLGPLIGALASSHWWDLPDVEAKFSRERNAPQWCRHAGAIRPLVVACLLRCADAIHLDGRRAPRFTRVRRQLSNVSAQHWDFQERLDSPSTREDAIYFTGGVFTEAEFESWWLCYETLSLANRELESCHALLSDKNAKTFAAKRIHSINDVTRLSELIKTEGWRPIDAPVRISNVAGVVMELGGSALYGDNKWVVLRELIQNAADAIRARRALEHRAADYGTVTITVGADGRSISVADVGIGMTEFVIKNYLLDFFKSFWTSDAARQAFKGHMHALRQGGRFGIGFFSIFMIAKEAKVRTRSAIADSSKTVVVHFKNGYTGRPIIREATDDERLVDAGTVVELVLMDDVEVGVLWKKTPSTSLDELVPYIAPAVDVDIVLQPSSRTQPIVKANDWLSLDGMSLLRRVAPNMDSFNEDGFNETRVDYIGRIADSLEVFNREDTVAGRLAIAPHRLSSRADDSRYATVSLPNIGVITTGGLLIGQLKGFAGLVEGQVTSASRQTGTSVFSERDLRTWAELQEQQIKRNFVDKSLPHNVNRDELLFEFSRVTAYLKQAPVRSLPIALSSTGELLFWKDLESYARRDVLFIVGRRPHKRVSKAVSVERRLELLESSYLRNYHEELFDYIPYELGDNVVICPHHWSFEYGGIRSSGAFRTSIDGLLRRRPDPMFEGDGDITASLEMQVLYAIGEFRGPNVLENIDAQFEEELTLPAVTGETVDAGNGFVIRIPSPDAAPSPD